MACRDWVDHKVEKAAFSNAVRSFSISALGEESCVWWDDSNPAKRNKDYIEMGITKKFNHSDLF